VAQNVLRRIDPGTQKQQRLEPHQRKEAETMDHTPCTDVRVLAVACLLALGVGAPVHAQSVFINELHYDNAGTDTGESVEIAGPVGTDLSGWSLVLYNGNGGAVYNTRGLSGLIPDQGNGFGTLVFSYPSDGIQNGAPDGVALVNASNTVVQFLSYEGMFMAAGGPADGLTSTDIGVSESGTTPVGSSLQLIGSGTNYGHFVWSSPTANTFGEVNTGQLFGSVAPTVLRTNPANGAIDVALDASIEITLSEAVIVTDPWFEINCVTSGLVTATVNGGPQSFTLDPERDFAADDTCTVTIVASQVVDQDDNNLTTWVVTTALIAGPGRISSLAAWVMIGSLAGLGMICSPGMGARTRSRAVRSLTRSLAAQDKIRVQMAKSSWAVSCKRRALVSHQPSRAGVRGSSWRGRMLRVGMRERKSHFR
jgi:hypothetical protein